ncbi:unnamed protein product [Aspergillus oryzae]|uniref:Unnamed protein product n=1 Tax=Aspergillus oryzae TaxID=5062 RepID=A0AAN4YBU5_ASPOZ|nr:unnamed protein product [Aspergillus oryzae]GMG23900.1 unnamed protein product [Aspergillus oryzae]
MDIRRFRQRRGNLHESDREHNHEPRFAGERHLQSSDGGNGQDQDRDIRDQVQNQRQAVGDGGVVAGAVHGRLRVEALPVEAGRHAREHVCDSRANAPQNHIHHVSPPEDAQPDLRYDEQPAVVQEQGNLGGQHRGPVESGSEPHAEEYPLQRLSRRIFRFNAEDVVP